MKIIKFKSNQGYCTNEYKKDFMPIKDHLGNTIMKPISTGIVKKTIKHCKMYYVPADKVEHIFELDGAGQIVIEGVNPIEITKEDAERIIKELEGE